MPKYYCSHNESVLSIILFSQIIATSGGQPWSTCCTSSRVKLSTVSAEQFVKQLMFAFSISQYYFTYHRTAFRIQSHTQNHEQQNSLQAIRLDVCVSDNNRKCKLSFYSGKYITYSNVLLNRDTSYSCFVSPNLTRVIDCITQCKAYLRFSLT